MTFLRLLLWPFSLLYGGIMLVRNMLYDTGWFQSKRFGMPVIAVGNLTVGGTGKTPHVEYLLRLLRPQKTAVLSRGYKRSTKGFVLADASATAATLGDEPFQYHLDFPEVTVAVSESRVAGMEKLLSGQPDLEVTVLDDAMQHRPIKPSLLIMLTDYNRPFYKDLVLPAGLLREPRKGAARADVIVVSKCPGNMSASEKDAVLRQIHRYSRPGVPMFFTSFRYGDPVALGASKQLSKRIVLLTGIANAKPLVNHLQAHQFEILQHLEYADHYHYTAQDLYKLQEMLAGEQAGSVSVVTTRKDAVKLMDASLQSFTQQLPIFYIPIEVDFLSDRAEFDALIRQHVASFSKG
jgi:tetraacyldisaccharide 4'-kinase